MLLRRIMNSILRAFFSLDNYTDLLSKRLVDIPLFSKKYFWVVHYVAILLYLAVTFIFCYTQFSESDGTKRFISAAFLTAAYFLVLYGIRKGRHSAIHSLIYLLLVNTFVALIIGLNIVVFSSGRTDVSLSLWLLIYGFLWIIYVLVSDVEAIKLSNGIITGISVLAFTCMGFFINTLSDKFIINFLISKLPQTEKAILELAHILQVNGYSIVQVLNASLGILLPFIGFSTFSIVLIDVKLYWLAKQNDT